MCTALTSHCPLCIAAAAGASLPSVDIQPGQGMYFSPSSGLFRAENCLTNSYGVAEKTTGLAAFPCRSCPLGMQTSEILPQSNKTLVASANFGAAVIKGFNDPKACVTTKGFGELPTQSQGLGCVALCCCT